MAIRMKNSMKMVRMTIRHFRYAMQYYLYNQIPGVWPKWTLAVLATNQADAGKYIKINHPGAKRAGVVTSGKVTADCGAVTDAAGEILKEINRA